MLLNTIWHGHKCIPYPDNRQDNIYRCYSMFHIFSVYTWYMVCYPFWSLILIRPALGIVNSCKQLLSKSEKRFVGTHWVQEGLGLSEVLCVRTVLFVGKCGVRFRRFKKGSRALATRANTHCLDQNWQSYIVHCSNHWAMATNLTYKLMKQCYFYS